MLVNSCFTHSFGYVFYKEYFWRILVYTLYWRGGGSVHIENVLYSSGDVKIADEALQIRTLARHKKRTFFCVSHLPWHVTFVYDVIVEDILHLPPVTERFALELFVYYVFIRLIFVPTGTRTHNCPQARRCLWNVLKLCSF